MTKDWRLVFQHGTPEGMTLTGFVDANWANELSDHSSTSGFVYKLAGAAISWSSKKQSSVALSSTEAEYIAGAHTTKEVIWCKNFWLRACARSPSLSGTGRGEREEEEKGRKEGEATVRAADKTR